MDPTGTEITTWGTPTVMGVSSIGAFPGSDSRKTYQWEPVRLASVGLFTGEMTQHCMGEKASSARAIRPLPGVRARGVPVCYWRPAVH
jgi:hypothetical protein